MSGGTVTLRLVLDNGAFLGQTKVSKEALSSLGDSGAAAGAKVARGMGNAELKTKSYSAITQHESGKVVRSHKRISEGVDSISTQMNRLQRYAGWATSLFVSAGVFRGLARMADEYQNIGARLRIASGNSVDFATSQQDVLNVALRTHTALGTTAGLVTKLSTSFRSLGADNLTAYKSSVALSGTVLKAVQLSGASASAADAAITQLGQGLASGTLRGDELNSILEQTPRLAQAIADGMGKTVGELRQLGAEGQITAQQIAQALRSQAADIDREYSQLPLTIGRAWTDLRTQVQAYIGQADTASGASNQIARAIAGIAAHIDDIARATLTLGKIVAAVYAGRMIKAGAAWVASLRAQTAATVALGEASVISGAGASASINKVTLGTLAARKAGVALAAVGKVALAAWTGWQIGKYLRDQFVEVRIGAIYFVKSTKQAWELLINFIAQGITKIKLWFEQMRQTVGRSLSGLLSGLAVEVAAIPAIGEGLSQTFLKAARAVLPATSNVGKYRAELEALEAQHQKNMAQIQQITDDMEAYERAQAAAKKGSQSGADAADGQKDALARLLEQLQANAAGQRELGESFTATIQPASEYDNIMSGIADRTRAYQEEMMALTQAQAQFRGEVQALFEQFAAGNISVTQLMQGVAAAANELKTAGQAAGMNQLTGATQRYASQADDLRATLSGVSREQLAINKAYKQAGGAGNAAATAARNQAQAALANRDAMASQVEVMREADDLAKSINDSHESPFERMEKEAARLREAMESTFDKDKLAEYQGALDNLSAERFAVTLGGVSSALRAMQGLTERGSDSYKKFEQAIALVDLAGQAMATTKAVNAILTQGEGDPYTGWARMAAMAAAVAPLLSSIGATVAAFGGGGGGGGDPTARRQETQGTGSVLGDAQAKSESILNATEITADATKKLVSINTGMLRALQTMQRSIGSASAMLARGAGQAGIDPMASSIEGSADGAIGALGDLFSGGVTLLGGFGDWLADLGQKIWGGSTKVVDQGIKLVGGKLLDIIDSIMIGAYQDVDSKSWVFGSTHRSEAFKQLDGGVGKQFQLILQSIVDTVTEAAKALGLPLEEIQAKIAQFQIETTKISLEGLTGEEKQDALMAVFGKIFDDLAGFVVPFIEQFQTVGEGLGETLVRVATSVQVMQEAVKRLGLSIDQADPEKFAQVSVALIELVGGVEEFITGMQSFVEAFAPDEFKAKLLKDSLTSGLEQVDLALPKTREGMWALMQSLDATTEAGREQIAMLMRLAPLADKYYDSLEKGAGALDKAAQAQLDYVSLITGLQAELGMNPLAQSLLEVAQWSVSTSNRLNELAKAQGLAGASAEDLALVQQVAAQRMSQAIAALYESSQTIVDQLFGTTEVATDASAAVNGFGQSMTDAAQKARDSMSLLLGDLSPYSDRKKLEMALEGQRAGTVAPEQVLQIARRLMASGADYRRVFDQVMAVGDRTQGAIDSANYARTADATGTLAGKTLSKAERYGMADQLANNIADLADAQGISFAEVADELGLNLADLGAALGLDNEALQAYLGVLASDNFGFNDLSGLVRAEVDRIVAAIGGAAYTGDTTARPDAPAFDEPAPVVAVTPHPAGVPARDRAPAPADPALVKRIDTIAQRLEDMGKALGWIARTTERSAEADEAALVVRRRAYDEAALERLEHPRGVPA